VALPACVVAALVFGMAGAAQAAVNVVPNPGFEQAGCGASTPIICGWTSYNDMVQAGSPGNYTMSLDCGPLGCYSGGYPGSVSASTEPDSCATIAPGNHPASFWYSAGADETVWLSASFFQTPDCTGGASAVSFNARASGNDAWQQATGDLNAPSGTQSVLFGIGASTNYTCDDYCYPSASFDDLDVVAAVAPDTTPPETTITSGPSATSSSTSASFEFTASESASFECSMDDAPFAACASPAAYSGIGDGSHTFRVRATDAAGNTDPTPAEQTWTVQTVGDFSIQAGPDSLSVLQGEGGTSMIQTTVTSGSAQAVYLSAAVQPAGAGVSVWFSPSSLTTGDRASMIVNVGVATTPGTYTITVTAVGESWTHTTTVMLTVTCCGSDFTTTVSPSALTLAPGSSVTFTVATTLISGTPQTLGASATVDWRVVTGVTYVPGTFMMGDSSTITITVGATAPPGTYPIGIRVANPNGSAMHDTTVNLIVKPASLSITSFTPASGPAGTTVDLYGGGFTAATNVTFNGTNASYTVDSDAEIHATAPSGATTGPISVSTPGGNATSSTSFTLIPPPAIGTVAPMSGPVGTIVDLQGGGFTGATGVTFNGTNASYTVDSDSEIHATLPAGATTGPISVSTPSGTTTSSSSFTVIAPPAISGFSPASGHAGQQVTINGLNFIGVTAVKLGTTSTKFVLNSSTKITAVVPTIPHGSFRWSVITAAGTATTTGSFRVR
jgi:hypothetical protein